MKLCGCKEKCFEKGECWGHFSGTMCKHLSEKKQKDKPSSFCMKSKEFVTAYFINKEYDKIKTDELKDDDFNIAENMVKISLVIFIVFCLVLLIHMILL